MAPSNPNRSGRMLTAAMLIGLILITTLAGCDARTILRIWNPLAPSKGPVSGLPVVHYDDLPPEAHDTIRLIDRGGPFPYDQDGQTFYNREGILPDQSEGYYREYTVETPGSPDRGARRIVAGADGELYYTDDHYDSFREVIR